MSVVPFTLEGFTIAPYARRPTRIVLFSTDSESIYICRIGNASTCKDGLSLNGCRRPDVTVLPPCTGVWHRNGVATIIPDKSSFVDVSTMPECDNHDQKNPIVDGVQDAIVPYSKSISITTS